MYEVLYEYLMIQDLNAMKLDWCEVGDARNAIVSYFYYPSRNCSIECLINHCSVQKVGRHERETKISVSSTRSDKIILG